MVKDRSSTLLCSIHSPVRQVVWQKSAKLLCTGPIPAQDFMKKFLMFLSMLLCVHLYADDFKMVIPKEMVDYFAFHCIKNKISVKITYLLVMTESEFKSNAINKNLDDEGNVLSVDEGVFQLNSKNYDYFKNKYNNGKDYDPYNWKDNIRIGCQVYADLVRQCGNYYDATASFCMGKTKYYKYINAKKQLPIRVKQKLNYMFNEGRL